jgi:hypothetical protein
MRPSPKPTSAGALSANFFCIFDSSGKIILGGDT